MGRCSGRKGAVESMRRTFPQIKRSKYKAVPTVIDGIRFASKLEAFRYIELKKLKAVGIVKEFKLQPKFPLYVFKPRNGKKVQPYTYIADFDITYSDGRRTIEDVKGILTKEFKTKQKFFRDVYPDLELVIVTKVNHGKNLGI